MSETQDKLRATCPRCSSEAARIAPRASVDESGAHVAVCVCDECDTVFTTNVEPEGSRAA